MDQPASAVIVLCGGTSRRLGSADKTEEPLGDATVLDTLLAGLPVDVPVICVGVPRPTSRPVQWTAETPVHGGPVAGIAAGLALVSAPVVVVLAGDQPFAGRVVADLLGELDQAPDADGACGFAKGYDQPLLAAYRTEALRRVAPAGTRDVSVRATLGSLNLRRVDVPGEVALDIDTPADLITARSLAGETVHPSSTLRRPR